jgi:hypothetical protein
MTFEAGLADVGDLADAPAGALADSAVDPVVARAHERHSALGRSVAKLVVAGARCRLTLATALHSRSP